MSCTMGVNLDRDSIWRWDSSVKPSSVIKFIGNYAFLFHNVNTTDI